MTYNLANCKSVLTFDGKPWNNQSKLPNIYIVDNNVYFSKGTDKPDEKSELLVVSLEHFHKYFARLTQQNFFKNLVPQEIQHTNFIQQNINKFVNEFYLIQHIGKGGFGRVYSAKSIIDLHSYAIKRVIIDCAKLHKDNFQETLKEFRILAKLNHGNIVRYHTAWFEKLDENDDECLPKQVNRISQSHSTYSPRTESVEHSNLSSIESNSLSNILSYQSLNTQTDLSSSKSEKQYSDDDIEFGTRSQSDQDFSKNGVVDVIKSKPPPKVLPKFALYIQMELCEMNLRDWLNARNDRLETYRLLDEDMKVTKLLARQLLKGVEYLHFNGVIHRDIKPANIFVVSHSGVRAHNGLQLKIGDFGLAKCFERDITDEEDVTNNLKLTANVGTAFYSAPEVSHITRKQISYDHKSDLFSVGIILLELMLKFQTTSELCRVVSDMSGGTMFSDLAKIWPVEAPYIKGLLSVNPEDRPEAYFILKNTWCFKTRTDDTIRDLESEICDLKKEKENLIKEKEKENLIKEKENLIKEVQSLRMSLQRKT